MCVSSRVGTSGETHERVRLIGNSMQQGWRVATRCGRKDEEKDYTLPVGHSVLYNQRAS